MRLDFTQNAGVCNFLAAVGRDVIILDGKEGVGTGDPLILSTWTRTDALSEATKFVGI